MNQTDLLKQLIHPVALWYGMGVGNHKTLMKLYK